MGIYYSSKILTKTESLKLCWHILPGPRWGWEMGWVGGGGGGRVGNVQGLTQSIKAESNYDCDDETPQ